MSSEPQNFAPVSPVIRSHAIGHVVSVTGSQAVVLLDRENNQIGGKRAELGAILKIDTPSSIILGLVSALSIPVPAQRDGEQEVRVAELELIEPSLFLLEWPPAQNALVDAIVDWNG